MEGNAKVFTIDTLANIEEVTSILTHLFQNGVKQINDTSDDNFHKLYRSMLSNFNIINQMLTSVNGHDIPIYILKEEQSMTNTFKSKSKAYFNATFKRNYILQRHNINNRSTTYLTMITTKTTSKKYHKLLDTKK